MFKKSYKLSIVAVLIIVVFVFAVGFMLGANINNLRPYLVTLLLHNDDWHNEIVEISIPSSYDGNKQKVMAYHAKGKNRPLIVSLHTWGGDYVEYDPISEYAIKNDYYYIHPNFRGPNSNEISCCSDMVIADIDDAIAHMIQNGASENAIYIIGLSGGGYTLFCTYLKSEYNAKHYAAWAAIADLEQWAQETRIRGLSYYDDIMACTSEGKDFNSRSPIQWPIPNVIEQKGLLSIYAGIYDGIDGSVPITHSINFYNKIIEATVRDTAPNKVSVNEKLKLLEFRQPLGHYGKIDDRAIYLQKETPSVKLIIFDGGHEMVLPFAFEDLMRGGK
ncbi:alpha/beta hydrolase family protein [Allomuricauda sp. SCSIO 65647]|uniref:alpha/beta hydrolase family protein n=1 Tax=Allomuricauda sp. SCSIO 65647 TaxID=2908843 RepID=UPI001F1EED77|nr:hypothetical protein [Muricauda sp. SCSIO 65647]UJH67019.1 hypothetical protein L0P89_13800 [Muricauda sp. SCSIO 65647]